MNSLKNVPSASQRPAVRQRAAGGRRGGVDRVGHIVRRIVEHGGAPGPDQVIRLQGALGNRQIAHLVEGGVPAHGVTLMRRGPLAAVAEVAAGAGRTGAQAPAAMRILWFNSVVLPVSEARDALMAKRPDMGKAYVKTVLAGFACERLARDAHDSGDDRLGFSLGHLANFLETVSIAIDASRGVKNSLEFIASRYYDDDQLAAIASDIDPDLLPPVGTPGGNTRRSHALRTLFDVGVSIKITAAREILRTKRPLLASTLTLTKEAMDTARQLGESFVESGDERLGFRLLELRQALNRAVKALEAHLGVKHSPAEIAAAYPSDEKLVEIGSELR